MTNVNDDELFNHSTVQLDNFLVTFRGSDDDDDINDDDDDDEYLLKTRVICMYNLHTEEWRQQIIPKHEIDKNGAPEWFYGAVAVVINGIIYTFGGVGYGKYADSIRTRNALWTLSKGNTGYFTWNFIESQDDKESPSPRHGHTGWEYGGKLWVFGGRGSSLERYLNGHGDNDIAGHDYAVNNQLLCYSPKIQKWTNPQCFAYELGARKWKRRSCHRADKVQQC